MADAATGRTRRVTPVFREEERVTPLELFFDLVFVLAITQCTALMADQPSWEGIAKGILVLAALWWSWVGYAWLTSVIEPEEGAVRLVIFAAMAAMLVVALCVPQAFDDLGLAFAIAYGFVRACHIALFWISSRDAPELRRSTAGLALGTAVGVGLLVVASFFDGALQGALWLLAISLDVAEPYFFGSEGWRLVPGHFAERHGLIMIIALGESIVAIGVGAAAGVTAGIAAAAVLGIGLVCAMWWLYFDVVAIVAALHLSRARPGKERNEMARDSYSYLHFPMVAGIVLVALGLKKTLEGVDDPLKAEIAFALAGGLAIYLLAHVAFRLRNVGTLSRQRLLTAGVAAALIPLATEIPSVVSVGILTALAAALIAYETIRFAERRDDPPVDVRSPIADGDRGRGLFFLGGKGRAMPDPSTNAERTRVCKILVRQADLTNLWTPEGPTPLAQDLLQQNGGTMSSGQRVLFLLAWVIWKAPLDPTKLKASEILGCLDDDNLHLVGTLLGAISHGHEALEEWLAKYEHE